MDSIVGLHDDEVKQSREKHGSNVIPEAKPVTFFDSFKEMFEDPMIKVLLVVAGVLLVLAILGYARFYEPIGIFVAIILVALVSAKTNVASDTKYRDIKHSIKEDVVLIYREGRE